MSTCPTASHALEHDTARRLESSESSSQPRLHADAAPHDGSHPNAILHGARLHDAFRHDLTGRLMQHRNTVMAAASPEPDAPDDAACDAPADNGLAFDRAPDPARDPAREALERTCLTVKRIAFDIGMPRATLEAYRLGTRRMPPSARVRLGTYLASHAAMLDGLAQALMAPPTVADA